MKDASKMTRPELVDALRSYVDPQEYRKVILMSTASLRGVLVYEASSKEDKDDDRTPPRNLLRHVFVLREKPVVVAEKDPMNVMFYDDKFGL